MSLISKSDRLYCRFSRRNGCDLFGLSLISVVEPFNNCVVVRGGSMVRRGHGAQSRALVRAHLLDRFPHRARSIESTASPVSALHRRGRVELKAERLGERSRSSQRRTPGEHRAAATRELAHLAVCASRSSALAAVLRVCWSNSFRPGSAPLTKNSGPRCGTGLVRTQRRGRALRVRSRHVFDQGRGAMPSVHARRSSGRADEPAWGRGGRGESVRARVSDVPRSRGGTHAQINLLNSDYSTKRFAFS